MATLEPCALYHRVSTLDQNPTLARDELHAAAARLSYTPALVEEETGSGARNDRPGLWHVMDAARKGTIRAVLVWKLDRFGRSALDVLANLRQLEGAGVRFCAVTQGLDVRPGGDPMSRLLLTVLAAVAEFERDLVVDRTKLAYARVSKEEGTERGRVARRLAGKKAWGRPPTPVTVDQLSSAVASLDAGSPLRRVARELGLSRDVLRRAVAQKGRNTASR